MTALKDQFLKYGFKPEEVEFSAAIARFFNHGGTTSRAHELVDLANQKFSQPQSFIAEGMRTSPPPILQPAPKPYQPRVIHKETIERRREQQERFRSKYKNSGGVPWSEVGIHEAHGLARDGDEARALLDACPSDLPNIGQTFGDVLKIKEIDKIIGKLRAK